MLPGEPVVDFVVGYPVARQDSESGEVFLLESEAGEGASSLSHRIQNKACSKSADLVRALAQVLNAEARALAEAGAELLQIDEPFLTGYQEDVGVAVEAINIVTQDVDVTWGLHVCYGNRYARPSWEGHVIQQRGWDRSLGLGVVDVKTEQIESAELIAQRILKALEPSRPTS